MPGFGFFFHYHGLLEDEKNKMEYLISIDDNVFKSFVGRLKMAKRFLNSKFAELIAMETVD